MAIDRGVAGPPSFSCESADAAWDRLTHAFLTHGAALPAHLDELIEAAPQHPLAHAAHGLLMLLLARRELVAVARCAHKAATAGLAADGGTRREQLYVEALGVWLDGRPSLAADTIDAVLAERPDDAFALKMAHAIRFLIGDAAGMRRSVEAAAGAYDTGHPAAGYVRGCHAFALEETGDYAAAEAAGRSGVELAPDDAWGLHAVTHVYDMTGRVGDGCAWLAPRQSCLSACSNFRYHVSWHHALFELDLGHVDRVLALYDTEIRADRTDDYRDIANAASMLARLAIEGVDVGERWAELADLAERRIGDACLAFADLHYALALSGGGRHAAADALAGRIARDAQAGAAAASDYAATARDVGAPAARGIEAFSLGRYDSAFRSLLAARRRMASIGGSHAQRDVFERLTIEAALRAGRPREARRLIEERARLRGALDRFGRERLARIDQNQTEAHARVPEVGLSLAG